MAGTNYTGRVVVVTGARRGIGKIVARHFLAEGAVVVGMSRGEDESGLDRYTHMSVDVGDDVAVREAFLAIGKTFGRVDILVNNAAVLTSQHAMLMPGTRAREMVTTNLLGTIFVSREAAKLMARRKWGRIINIGSMAAALEPIGDSVYAATKAAVATLGGVLARELSHFNITCNTLGVTALPTEMLEQLPQDKIAAVIASLPIPRMATEDDILNVLDFFASERSSYITAQTVFLGGVH